jgi:hypothetical protein
VRLLSADGAWVDLRVVGYQYEQPPAASGAAAVPPPLAAEGAGEGELDWDANWLVIRGQVRAASGREWTFTDPCLTTWEAARLLEWLEALGRGEVQKALAFTEPNLRFTLDAQDGERIRLRVRFSAESLPSGPRTSGPRTSGPRTSGPQMPGPQTAGYDVPLDVSRADLAAGTRAWATECQQFPPRAPRHRQRDIA